MGPDARRPDGPGGGALPVLNRYFPIVLDLHERHCLVVGGGPVAARKVRSLADAGAYLVVVAPQISDAMAGVVRQTPASNDESGATARPQRRPIEVRLRAFEPADLDDMFLVVTATDDSEVSHQVAAEARKRAVLINAADDPTNCDFILPAVVRRGDVQIAITTGARSPALARHLRQRLDRDVPREYAALAHVLSTVREELRRAGTRASAATWQEAITDDVLVALRAGDVEAATAQVRARLTGSHRTGRVVLVGAGPGDPGLITVAGMRAIQSADVIVYDRLVNPDLLESARAEAEIVYAGKRRGGGPMSQDEINQLICAEAITGKVVVRLKGGDPFVFGRGGEEALAAVAAGVPFTVIPGISAAMAVPAYAGIPVTHRGMASTFTVLTGHEDPTKAGTDLDWDVLARIGGTLVLLMGVQTLPAVCERLVAGGMPPTTFAAVIQDGTLDSQRVVTGTVADIAARATEAGIRAPAATVIGAVVDLAPVLKWWQSTCIADAPSSPTDGDEFDEDE